MENSKSNSPAKKDKKGPLAEKLFVFSLHIPNNSHISAKYGL
jgi:hypothetical protein